MTLTIALCILAIGALLCGATVWAIHATEQRIRTLIRAGLTRPDDGHTAALIRSRALDDEYRQLVLNAHNDE